jgi:uncharacterized protein involved in type VI secretion and phage assembly
MSAADARVDLVELKLGGSAITGEKYDALHDLRIDQSMHVPSMMVARFEDPDFALLDADFAKIGDKVEIKLPGGGSLQPVFFGEVSAIATEQGAGSRHELVITALANTYKLARKTELATYTNKSYKDVVSGLASGAGLTVGEVSATGGAATQHEYLYQTTTAYAFISEIAQQLGFDWWVDNEDKFYFKPREMAAGTPVHFGQGGTGTELSKFKARYSAAERAEKVTVRGIDPKTLEPVSGDDTTVKDQTKAVAGTTAKMASRLNSQATKFGGALISGASVVETQKEAGAVAKALGERLAAARFTAKGTAHGDARIAAGGVVSVTGVGQSLEGDYLVTNVQHTYTPSRGAMTNFEVGGGDAGDLVELLGDSGTAPTSYVGQLGLVIGDVTNITDPDKIGRVKVKFPWLDADNESHWAKVIGYGAFTEAGLQMMPSVGDKVLVGFERGDVRRPLILGGVWTTSNKPPMAPADFEDSGSAKSWMMKTRTGHMFTALEGKGKGDNSFELSLSGTKKNRVYLGDDKITVETDGMMIEMIDGTGSISLDGKGNVVIDCKKLTVKASDSIEMKATKAFKAEGSQKAEIKGQNAKIEGQIGVDVKGGVSANVKATTVNIN